MGTVDVAEQIPNRVGRLKIAKLGLDRGCSTFSLDVVALVPTLQSHLTRLIKLTEQVPDQAKAEEHNRCFIVALALCDRTLLRQLPNG